MDEYCNIMAMTMPSLKFKTKIKLLLGTILLKKAEFSKGRIRKADISKERKPHKAEKLAQVHLHPFFGNISCFTQLLGYLNVRKGIFTLYFRKAKMKFGLLNHSAI